MASLHQNGIGDPGHLMPFWPINSTQRQWEAIPSDSNFDLRFPWSVDVYDRMSRTDGQVSAVFKAITLPILRANWDLNTDGVRDEVVAHVREDLALPEIGQSAPRNRISSVVWTDHLREALRALVHGFACFEQTYEVDTTDREVPVVHLKKLAPRLASTVLRILVDADGSLAAVVQKPPLWAWNITGNTAEAKWWGIVLPVANIVMYSHEREGADWYGRALALDTKLPTPDGWTTMGRVQVGDRVFDETGTVRRVVAKSPVWKDRPTYRVRFSSGQEVLADENHLWRVQGWLQRNTGSGDRTKTLDLTTKQLAEKVMYSGRNANWSIAQAGPLDYQRADLLIDPYVLGYWLGDGHTAAAVITTMDRDVITEFEMRGYPCKQRLIKAIKPTSRASSYGVGNDLQFKLRAVGLLGNKHVPEGYLRASYQQRLDLLCGLMDSDGNVGNRNGQRGEFSNTNRVLADAVMELVRGLGGKANMFHNKCSGTETHMLNGQIVRHVKDSYRVDFSLPDVPFKIGRKVDAYHSDRRRARTKHFIESIELVEPMDTVCIEVDSPSHLFVVGDTLVPTHNSILREAYKDFLLKDQFVRLNAQGIERNSMGVPVYHLADESRRPQAEQIVQDFRAGSTAGLVIPAGDSIELLGVSGSVRDALPSIQYHDQAISKASLAMFLDLGHDRGAQNLGSTFISTFIKSLQSLADWIAATATEYIIRDLVAAAYGPDEPYPRLVSGDLAEQQVLAPADIALLVTAGAITKDASLDEWLRKSGGLPAPSEPVDPATEVPVDQRVNQPIPPGDLPPTPQAIDVTTQEQAAYVGKLLGRVKDLTRRARSK